MDKTKSVIEDGLGKTEEEKDEQAKSLNDTDGMDGEAHEVAAVVIVH